MSRISPIHYSPRRQSRWVPADYGGKDLCRKVSFEPGKVSFEVLVDERLSLWVYRVVDLLKKLKSDCVKAMDDGPHKQVTAMLQEFVDSFTAQLYQYFPALLSAVGTLNFCFPGIGLIPETNRDMLYKQHMHCYTAC